MYHKLGYPIASTVLGALAFGFSALPFALMVYGPRIRAMGRVARIIAEGIELRDEKSGASHGERRTLET